MTDEEIKIFAESGVNIAHCPRSNLKLASGIAPVTEYRLKGVNVAIGTDGAASNNTLDMLSEMRMTALLAKGSSSDATAISASQALRMATFDGATALGLIKETGSIEAGKWADLTCVDLNRLHSQPVYDPVSQLVYTARADQITDVWIAGKHQLDNGRLTQIDTNNLLERSNEWRDRFAVSIDE
jgi:5-methylthioadenosine/S-adenosylhomocysteine deaminase